MTCDLCYSRKEKCVPDIDAHHCRRCMRLGVRCTNDRRQQRLGRRPKVEQLPSGTCGLLCFDPGADKEPLLVSTSSSAALLHSSDRTRRRADEATTTEATLTATKARLLSDPVVRSHIRYGHPLEPSVYLFNDPENFYRVHRRFMIGRSFNHSFQRAIWAYLPWANGILIKAYGAMFTTWNREYDRPKTQSELNTSMGSECLSFLRGQCCENPEDAAALLMLSQILFVYHLNVHYTSAHSIVRSAMFTAAAFYEKLLLDETLDPITITPVLVDTLEALIRRELPSVKVSLSTRCIVDRTVGLCWPLLILLQELCEYSHHQKSLHPDDRNDDRKADYADIEHRIKHWEPVFPKGFCDQHPPPLADAMFFQARLYRSASLLIIHRLKYRFGEQDEKALSLADMIAYEILNFLSWAPEEYRNIPLGLPLLVAAIEDRDICAKVTPQLPVLRRNPELLTQYVRFIDLVWESRQQGYGGLWFDLVGIIQPPIVL